MIVYVVDEPIRWTLNCKISGTLALIVDLVPISEVHILINVVRELDISHLDKLLVTERIFNEL